MTIVTEHASATALATEAPLQIELRFRVHRSAAETFDLVTTRLPEWFGAIHEVRWDHTRSTRGPGKIGACSERACDFDGKLLREEIVSFEPGRRYAYRVDFARSEMKMPLADHLGVFEVEPHERGAVVTWRQHFRARWYVPAALLRWQMRDKMMRPAVENLLARFGGAWLDLVA